MHDAVDDRQRQSAVAHASSLMWGLVSGDTVNGLVARLGSTGLSESSSVLDLGCGPAELLHELLDFVIVLARPLAERRK